jgi:hypothetical protein
MARRKHKRGNRSRWDRAWNLVVFWYHEQAKEGAVAYTVTGQKASVAVLQDGASGDTLAQARKDRPENWGTKHDKAGIPLISADGKERRYLLPEQAKQGFWGVSTDTVIVERSDGSRHIVPLEPRILYARQVMRTVGKLSSDSRLVLEMRAATWDFSGIAAEIGCGEPTARQYFAEGVGIIMAFQEMNKPT